MMEPRRRFRIMKELSEGAFGKVYMAEMITGDNFKSVVAIKLLHGKWVSNQEIAQRSRDEARVLGLLHHRNIVRVEDLTSINGQCAVIMEYLEGVDLKTLIRYCREKEMRVPRRVVFELIASTASALDAAYHRKTLHGGEPLRVIHRDIKPSNVMLTVAGEIKVLDFGTARASFEHREAETQALAFGSAAYMAPERIMGDPDTPAADVLSLAITLYELLSLKSFGKIYVRNEKYDEAKDERVDGLDLRDLDAERGEQVRSALRLMLAYNPEDRPKAGQVVELMEALAEEMHDGSIRRFCREVVDICHRNMECPANPNDPFTGSTLFEDTTRVRSEEMDDISGLKNLNIGPAPERSVSTLSPVALTNRDEATSEYIAGDELVADVLPTLSRDPVGTPPAKAEPPETGEANYIPLDSVSGPLPDPVTDIDIPRPGAVEASGVGDRPSTKSAPIPKRESGGWLAAVIVGGGLLVLLAIIAVVIISVMQPKTTKVMVPETLPAGPVYASGGQVNADRAGEDGGSLWIILQGGDGAKVVISGNQTDYSYRWDGTGSLQISNLEAGTYRTTIRGSSGMVFLQARVRARRRCTYEYNLSAGGDRWASRGCQ